MPPDRGPSRRVYLETSRIVGYEGRMSAQTTDRAIVVRWPLGARLGSLFVTLLIGVVAFPFLFLGVALVANGELLGLFIAAVGAFMCLLFAYVLRDTRGKVGWRIAIGADGLRLDLPGGRSLIHRPKPVHTQIGFNEIEAIETRLEAYSGIGMTNMQRIFMLKLKAGDLIIVGEDRALATGLASAVLSKAITQIRRFRDLEVRDLGMVEGRSGFLTILFASAPPWNTPSLGAERQEELWRRARMTGMLASWVPTHG